MPTARELLEQADALMRRNRGDTGIPVLTDSVPEVAPAPGRGVPAPGERGGSPGRIHGAEPLALRERGLREDQRRPPEGGRVTGVAPAAEPLRRPPEARPEVEPDPPLLTDAVEAVPDRAPPVPSAEVDQSLWLGPDTIDPALHSITGPAPDTVAVVPPVTLRAPEPTIEAPVFNDDPDPTVTRTLRAAGSAPTPPPLGSAPQAPPPSPAPAREPVPAIADDEHWRALAEQISMQVLQRLDLFVDTGLKAQLATHLQPIVARASAELVGAINDHVGQLVRSYVADAIEREIAQWREQNK